VFIALMIIHMLPGWHQGDMNAVPGEEAVMDTLRVLAIQPGEYRFPYGRTSAEMTSPAFVEKMTAGPVGVLTIRPNGELPFGRFLVEWIIYSLIVAVFAGYVTGRTHSPGTPFMDVFQISATVAFCCYAMAHWQNWIWWGKSTRYTIRYSIDGVIFGLVTGATFGWLWPK
jgi:hypothetical protein